MINLFLAIGRIIIRSFKKDIKTFSGPPLKTLNINYPKLSRNIKDINWTTKHIKILLYIWKKTWNNNINLEKEKLYTYIHITYTYTWHAQGRESSHSLTHLFFKILFKNRHKIWRTIPATQTLKIVLICTVFTMNKVMFVFLNA